MQDKNINLKSFIPHVGHTNLLYIASVVWFFAGGMLLYRGFMGVMIHSEFLLPKVHLYGLVVLQVCRLAIWTSLSWEEATV